MNPFISKQSVSKEKVTSKLVYASKGWNGMEWVGVKGWTGCVYLAVYIKQKIHGIPKPTTKPIIKPSTLLLPLIMRLPLFDGGIVGVFVGVGRRMIDDGSDMYA